MNDMHKDGRDQRLDTSEPEVEGTGSAGSGGDAATAGDAPEVAQARSGPARDDPAADPRALSREQLESELELARAEIERLQDQSLRRQADLINYRRRVQREIAESVSVGQGKVLELIVPVVADFERAVDAEVGDARAYQDGVELILRSLHKVLEQLGVERIEPRGEPFDPRYHEAVARHQTEDQPEGHVLEVFQAGYRLGDRLIRPATVVVAFGQGAEEAPEGSARAGDGAEAADDG